MGLSVVLLLFFSDSLIFRLTAHFLHFSQGHDLYMHGSTLDFSHRCFMLSFVEIGLPAPVVT